MDSPVARALNAVQDAITQSRAVSVLAGVRAAEAHSRPDVHAVLQVFASLSIEQARFGEVEFAIVHAAQLQPILEAAWWAKLVTAVCRATMPDDLAAELIKLSAHLDMVTDGFPALAALIDSPGQRTLPTPVGSLVVIVTGPAEQSPALTQIASAIEAVNQLWSVAEVLTGQSGKLSLVSTQFGDTTELHFDGQREPLQELSQLLTSVNEQTGRLPSASSEQHAALVPPMLPILDRIGRSGRSDSLRVRTAVESGVRHFLQAGCSLRPGEPAMAPPAPPLPTESRSRVRFAARTPAPPKPEQDASYLAKVIAEERRQVEAVGDVPRRGPQVKVGDRAAERS